MATTGKQSTRTQPSKSAKDATIVNSTTPSERLIKEIRRNTRKIFSAEQKVLIVMEGIRQELSVSELCRKYGNSTQTYYTWNKEFIEAGKRQLSGDILRQATSSQVTELKAENTKLKESLADLVVRYDIGDCGHTEILFRVMGMTGIGKVGDHPHRQTFGDGRQPHLEPSGHP